MYAAGFIDITPNRPLPAAGYSGEARLCTGEPGTLECNAIALRVVGEKPVVLASVDALFVGPVVAGALEQWLQDAYDIPRSHLILIASHTHFAPSLDPTRPRLGAANDAHVSWATDRIRELIAKLISGPFAPLHAAVGSIDAPFNVNRRRPWSVPHIVGRGISRAPVNASHPQGERDERLTVIPLRSDPEGLDQAFIVHYACHPTAKPGGDRWSAEFVGSIREQLRGFSGPAAPVVFLQGFAGNLRPTQPDEVDSRVKRSGLSGAVHMLAYGPADRPHTEESWQRWASGLGRHAVGALSNATARRPIDGDLTVGGTRVSLEAIAQVPDSAEGADFRRLRIGSLLDMVAVSAEPVIELRDHLKGGQLGVGYLGDVFGYWPTDGQLREGGYEASGFVDAFHLRGRLRDGRDAIFRRAIDGLTKP